MTKKKHYAWTKDKPPPGIEPHSLAKHRIFRKYLSRYIEIVTANSSQEVLRITFVDGFSGGGLYKTRDGLVPGSPLILLETAAEMETKLSVGRPKGFKIDARFIFIDENKHNTDYLRAQIELSPFKDRLDKTIQIWTGDFNTLAGNASRIARQQSPRAGRAIFLLDQYGWSQARFAAIRQILNALEKAEIFLTFSVDSLIDYLSENSLDMRAFGNIDMDRGLVREIVGIKEAEQVGYRSLIQNVLYSHVQQATGAPYYSPFFIKSLEAHRSYWLIHLSRHPEARNEIGMIHWDESNSSVHHGGAGLNSLGYTPDANPEQFSLEFNFDERARKDSKTTLLSQLPKIIYESAQGSVPPTVEELFNLRCNDTPVVRDMLRETIVGLRDEKAIEIFDETGVVKPRARNIRWNDRISVPIQRSLLLPHSIMLRERNKKT